MLSAIKGGTLKRNKGRSKTGSEIPTDGESKPNSSTGPRRGMFRRRTTQGDSTSSVSLTDRSESPASRKAHHVKLFTKSQDMDDANNSATQATLSLKALLSDVESQLEFEQFLEEQHAGENLRFWQELTFYRDGLVEAVLGDGVPAGFLGGVRAGVPSRVTEGDEEDGSVVSGSVRDLMTRAKSVRASLRKRSLVASRRFLQRKSAPVTESTTDGNDEQNEDVSVLTSASELADVPKELPVKMTREEEEHAVYLDEARRLYDKYIDENAKHWVCTDNNTIKTLKRQLDEEPDTVGRDFFLKVQRQIYKTMQQDLLPRFLKSKYAPVAPSPRAQDE